MVKALYFSGYPNREALAPLEENGWEVEVIQELPELEAVLRQIESGGKLKPNVVLLGGSVRGGEGLHWKQFAPPLIKLGVEQFVPFSSVEKINGQMINDERFSGVRVLDFLGTLPHQTIALRDDRLRKLVEAVESSVRLGGPEREAQG